MVVEYKIDDVAKLFQTTNFAIYSYITKYPELRQTLKAKSGVLTINERGVDLLSQYIKNEGKTKTKISNQPVADDLYGEAHPDVTVKQKPKQKSGQDDQKDAVLPKEKEQQPVFEPEVREDAKANETLPPPVETKDTTTDQPYQSFSDFKERVPMKAQDQPLPGMDLAYREMKEALLYLREQLDKKDQQIADLSRMLENQQILFKQEQLNVKVLEDLYRR